MKRTSGDIIWYIQNGLIKVQQPKQEGNKKDIGKLQAGILVNCGKIEILQWKLQKKKKKCYKEKKSVIATHVRYKEKLESTMEGQPWKRVRKKKKIQRRHSRNSVSRLHGILTIPSTSHLLTNARNYCPSIPKTWAHSSVCNMQY